LFGQLAEVDKLISMRARGMLAQTDEVVLRWFVLVVALLVDPAGVLLLLASTRRAQP
jgi:hypothetical protein